MGRHDQHKHGFGNRQRSGADTHSLWNSAGSNYAGCWQLHGHRADQRHIIRTAGRKKMKLRAEVLLAATLSVGVMHPATAADLRVAPATVEPAVGGRTA